MSKRHRSQLEGAPNGQIWDNTIMIVIDDNTQYKRTIYESILSVSNWDK